jgi:hypothetical protein
MLYVRNFNPEWGYLAPAPSLVRTMRLVAVAAVIGATASGAVVFALARQPAAEESVAARTLVQRVETAAALRAPPAAEVLGQAPHVSTADARHAPGMNGRQGARIMARADTDSSGAGDSAVASTVQRATIAAALTKSRKATAKAPIVTAAATAPAPAAYEIARVSVSDAAHASKMPNKKSPPRAKDQQAKDQAAGVSRVRVAMVTPQQRKTAPQPSGNNVLRKNVAPDDNNPVRDDDSLLARTMGVTDHVIAATHRAVSTIGGIPTWIGSIGNDAGG